MYSEYKSIGTKLMHQKHREVKLTTHGSYDQKLHLSVEV